MLPLLTCCRVTTACSQWRHKAEKPLRGIKGGRDVYRGRERRGKERGNILWHKTEEFQRDKTLNSGRQPEPVGTFQAHVNR